MTDTVRIWTNRINEMMAEYSRRSERVRARYAQPLPDAHLKADLSLAERQRLEANDQRKIRKALVRRHATVPDEDFAIEATQTAMTVDSPAYRAMAARLRD